LRNKLASAVGGAVAAADFQRAREPRPLVTKLVDMRRRGSLKVMASDERSSQEDLEDDESVERLMDAYSRGIDALKVLVLWIEAGAVGDFEIPPASMVNAMRDLEWFMRELRDGVANGKMSGGPPMGDVEFEQIGRLRSMIESWLAGGELVQGAHEIAERIVELTDGTSWREEPTNWSKWESK
jgi:hypothetical protein